MMLYVWAGLAGILLASAIIVLEWVLMMREDLQRAEALNREHEKAESRTAEDLRHWRLRCERLEGLKAYEPPPTSWMTPREPDADHGYPSRHDSLKQHAADVWDQQ